jgi:hypothetical protein
LLGDQPQADKDQQTYSCPECGQAVAQDAKFCGHCGTPLNLPAQENPDNSRLTGVDRQRQNTKTNSELMITIALIVAVLLVGGSAFVLNTVLQESLPTSSAPITPLTSTPPQESLKILSHSSYVDIFGCLHVVGELHNEGSQNTERNKVTVTFYDAEGNPIATASSYSFLSIIRPDQKSPFEIILTLSENWATYELDCEGQTTEKETYNLNVDDVSLKQEEAGWGHLIGKVTNIGNETLDGVSVVATFYDQHEKVVDVITTFCGTPQLRPGESSAFLMMLDTRVVNNMERYSLEVEGFKED